MGMEFHRMSGERRILPWEVSGFWVRTMQDNWYRFRRQMGYYWRWRISVNCKFTCRMRDGIILSCNHLNLKG